LVAHYFGDGLRSLGNGDVAAIPPCRVTPSAGAGNKLKTH
jgi:hypothetical protein